jgi:Cu/Ag efflux protein CusF
MFIAMFIARQTKNIVIMLIMLLLIASNINCGNNNNDNSGRAGQLVVKTFSARGVIKGINKEKQKVTIDHEKIDGYMDAMTMDFYVPDRALLDTINTGDKVQFTLKNEAGIEAITELKKL